ncbi:MAG: gp53-like domain-containing protein [Aeromonas jandaei]
MGIAQSLPKAWKKINELISGKLNKAGDTCTGVMRFSDQVVISDGYAFRYRKSDNSGDIWLIGTVGDKMYAFENGYDVDIRGKIDFINNPEINNGSPYLEFNNGSTNYGYVGFGSATGIMQVVNRVTGKALDLHSNGKLRYDGHEITNMSNFNYSASINGYSKLPSNMIIQKGTYIFPSVANGANTETTINLPVAFTSGNDYMVVTDVCVAFTPTAINANHHTKRSNSFVLRCSQNAGSDTTNIVVDWIAIGY